MNSGEGELKMRQLPIRWKIMTLSYAVVIFSLLIGGIVIIANIQQKEEKELRIRSMNTARTVAELSDIQESGPRTNRMENSEPRCR